MKWLGSVVEFAFHMILLFSRFNSGNLSKLNIEFRGKGYVSAYIKMPLFTYMS